MRWPLVGRDAALDHAAAQLEAGTGIAILGPAGVGKSRLLHELCDGAERSGAAVVSVVASGTTSTIPFAPFVELLPGGPTPDRLAMLGAARMTLDARRRSGGL
ncbi:MAG: ATP-binding protein, partial [Ilumatobacter sp.]|nr:ATP-binding protein [Ilumatobacter sp.]